MEYADCNCNRNFGSRKINGTQDAGGCGIFLRRQSSGPTSAEVYGDADSARIRVHESRAWNRHPEQSEVRTAPGDPGNSEKERRQV